MFHKIGLLEKEIDDYLGTIQRSGIIFYEGLSEYLDGRFDLYSMRVEEINNQEKEADRLRRHIEHQLYSNMLIPDARGDVLGLLETLDDVVDEVKRVMVNLDIERPEIYTFLKADFKKQAEFTHKSLLELSKAASCFFTNIGQTNNYIERVSFYESEVDKVEVRLKKSIFQSEKITLFSKKLQLRYFVEDFAKISDSAEDVCERLAISVIKRTI